MENKICVYTVCSEMSKFVDRWCDSVSEADRVIAIVHDTKDDTSEKMIEYGIEVGFTYYQNYNDERGRNEALTWAVNHAPECNIFVYVPVAQVLDPGWAAIIKENWKENTNACIIKEIYDDDEFSTGTVNYAHGATGWHWKDTLLVYATDNPVYYDLSDKVILYNSESFLRSKHHLDIMKRWHEESNSIICLEKYVKELLRLGKEREAYRTLLNSIETCDKIDNAALYYCAYTLAKLANKFGDNDIVLKYLDMAESSGVLTRSLYVLKAKYYAEIKGDYREAVQQAIFSYTKENKKYEDFVNNGEVEEIIAFYFYKLKRYDDAFDFSEQALEMQPDNEEFKKAHELYRRFHLNKICVYTTCYNESKFIDKWLENNKDADHIVVLIHDCKDDSEEKFIKAQKKQKISIGHGFYKEWRFDRGKEDSLHLAYSMAPECNIFVFTSLDELWDPGWAEEVKKNWIPGETQQCWYNFVQSHDDLGNDTGTTYFNWMISKDRKWHWEYPIHEAILYGDKEMVNGINLFDTVKLQHWPDYGKPRNYLPLHRLRLQEYGNDISYLYLIRECILQGEYDEAYDLASKFNHEETELNSEESAYIWVMQGICCERFERYDEAIKCYKTAHDLHNNYRTPLVRAATIYAKVGAFNKSEELFNKAFKETINYFSWINDPWDWRSKPFYWLSQNKSRMGNDEEALGYALFASLIDETDDQKQNYKKMFEACSIK